MRLMRNDRRSPNGERLADHYETGWCQVIGCYPVSIQNPLHPLLPPLASDAKVENEDDAIARVFEDEDRLFDLRVWRFLRIRYPHLSTNIHELDREIAFERRKRNS